MAQKNIISYIISSKGEYLQRFYNESDAIASATKLAQFGHDVVVHKETVTITVEEVISF